MLFVMFVNHAKQLKHIQASFFTDFQLIGYAYELLRCPHVEIWRFSWRRRQQTDRQITPAHAHGVINCCLATNLTTGKTIYMIFYGGYMILY